jgi:riboflavin synthase
MFTGLVEAVGEVAESTATEAGIRLRIETALAAELALGDSLAVNGVCLTVVQNDGASVQADVGPETVRVTTLGGLGPQSLVNLERPLRADARFGGHFVQGHVDAVGQVVALRVEAEYHWLTVSFPSRLAPYLVAKGSIAVDGISLTVATLGTDRFDVMVVPFTIDHTNLKRLHAGDRVNLEVDMVGKYVVRAAELAGLSFKPSGPEESIHS